MTVTTQGYFGSPYFGIDYFASAYFKDLVKVPAPQAVPSGGGGGIWPLSRMRSNECSDEDLIDFPKLYAEKCRKSNLGKSHESIPRKKSSPFWKDKSEIYDLKEKISVLKRELAGTYVTGEKARRREELLRRELEAQNKRLDALYLRVKGLERRVHLGKVSLEIEKEKHRQSEASRTSLELAEPPPVALPVPAPVSPSLPLEIVTFARRVMAAAPWVISGTITAAATYHLVPDDKAWLKATGYAAAGGMGIMAAVSFMDGK